MLCDGRPDQEFEEASADACHRKGATGVIRRLCSVSHRGRTAFRRKHPNHANCVPAGGGAETLASGIWTADRATRETLGRFRAELDRHDKWRQERMNLLSGCVVLELKRQLALHAEAAYSLEPENYHYGAFCKNFIKLV